MAQELTVEEVQEKLLKVRQEQGISETVKPIRSIVKKQLSEVEQTQEEKRCPKHDILLTGQLSRYCSECDREEKEAREEREQKRIEEENERKEAFHKKVADNPEEFLEKIGVGERYLKCSFENYQGGDKIKKICKDIVDNPCDLILTGPAGSGKTHLAVAIFRELIKKRIINMKYDYWEQDGNYLKNAKFITVPDLLLQIRQVFNEKFDKTEADIVNSYDAIGYLLLDDLGAEKTTEWSITTLYTIIDRRYRDILPTIVTTNLTIEQIGSQISERIASRLSSGKVIKINAPDYRKKR